jgi:hypothetical protein
MVVEAGRADRLPPHDTSAEEAVLASILVDPDAVLEVLSSNLKPEDFYREAEPLDLRGLQRPLRPRRDDQPDRRRTNFRAAPAG